MPNEGEVRNLSFSGKLVYTSTRRGNGFTFSEELQDTLKGCGIFDGVKDTLRAYVTKHINEHYQSTAFSAGQTFDISFNVDITTLNNKDYYSVRDFTLNNLQPPTRGSVSNPSGPQSSDRQNAPAA